MKMKYCAKGAIIENKVTGGNWEIISVSGKPVTSAIAVMLDPETGEQIPEKTVTITERNAICFRYICNPTVRDVSGFSLDADGILLENGIPATDQGSLRFNSILAANTENGFLVLEDTEHIYIYDPRKDVFTASSEVPMDSVFHQLKEDAYGLFWNAEIKDEDADAEKDTEPGYESMLLFITKKGFDTYSLSEMTNGAILTLAGSFHMVKPHFIDTTKK